MAGILDFLGTAFPRSIFGNLKNYDALQRGMNSAQEGIWGTPNQAQVTPQVGTPPGEQAQSGGANSNPFNYSQYPKVKNADGSESNVVTKSFNIDGKETLLPTMVGGQRLTDQQAIDNFKKTGKHFGQFATPEEADAAASKLEASMQQPLAQGLNASLPQNTQPRGWDASLSPDRAQAYTASLPKPGLLDAVPQQQRPFIEGLAKAMGPDAAAKAAYESNVTKPMTAYETANLAQQGSRPVFAPDGETGYAKGQDGTYQPVIKGAPKPPQSRTIQRGADTVTQQLNPVTNQFEDLATAPRQLPPQPQAAMSPERLTQEQQLIKDRQTAQTADEASQESEAQAIANYQQAPLTNFAMAKPAGTRLMARVMQINPQYRSQNFRMSNDAQTKFAGGTTGNLVRSFNVGISHLNTLGELTDALGNNADSQLVNRVQNAFKTQFGSEAPTNFNAAKAIVGDEIIKAIVGSGGALADRENAQNQISAANTPAQLKGVIATYKKLMAGQLKGLKQQYETSTFLKNFDEKLAPETVAELEGLAAQGGGTPPPAAAPKGPPAPPKQGDIIDGYRFLGGDPKLQRNWQRQ